MVLTMYIAAALCSALNVCACIAAKHPGFTLMNAFVTCALIYAARAI